MEASARIRIGELARRVGVTPELLRAWETRYGLVSPERTEGGLRLYSDEDERRVRAMRERIAGGLSAAEAARLAKRPGGPLSLDDVVEIRSELESSLRRLDEPAAQEALDRLFAGTTLSAAVSEVILPFLHELGRRWAVAEVTVAQEHFASNVIGGRLRALARGWGRGTGPRAVLACLPGEQHELGLVGFGLALREQGWRITYLGADTPLDEISGALEELGPDIVVLAATTAERFLKSADDVRALSGRVRVGIGGGGASEAVAESLDAEWLGEDVSAAAAALAT